MYSLDDTIAAIATSIGQNGVGIVKVSGPEALTIAGKIFRPAKGTAKLRPHRLQYGYIVDPDDEATIDEALVVYMPKPHSYTRQDVVEFQAHGGLIPVRHILQLVLKLGARPAEAGEMTLRAFLNGRMDLAQAEAVLDVVEAKTEAALRVASEQLSGTLSGQVSAVRALLLDTLAFLEASIDFVEDEIPAQDVDGPLAKVSAQLEQLIHSADHGLIYRQGVRAAIVGRPNVGKSSLLNALLRGDRAIVTDIPGTTRDTLEETVNLGGIPLVLVDTAGIRSETADVVERMGVERSQAALQRADIALTVVDGSCALEQGDWEIANLISAKASLLIVNKIDLPTARETDIPSSFLPEAKRVHISALKNQGLEILEQEVTALILGGRITLADTPMVSNPRHKALLQHAHQYVQSAIEAHQAGLTADLVSIDVRESVEALGKITGETVTEDLLETIFSKFCIGK
jgi:tRNA modification GTPase